MEQNAKYAPVLLQSFAGKLIGLLVQNAQTSV